MKKNFDNPKIRVAFIRNLKEVEVEGKSLTYEEYKKLQALNEEFIWVSYVPHNWKSISEQANTTVEI